MKKFLSIMLAFCMLASLMAVNVSAETSTVGDFILEEVDRKEGKEPGFQYNDTINTLTITKGGDYRISQSKPLTQCKIVVSTQSKDEIVYIELNNINIDVSEHANQAAINIISSEVFIEFHGINVLKSGENCAGLQVNPDSSLELFSYDEVKKGQLKAYGGYHAAGIGGGGKEGDTDSGTIHIMGEGTVIAQGGAAKSVPMTNEKGEVVRDADGKPRMSTWSRESTGGAGIGGGNFGSAVKEIAISQNAVVNAQGGHWAAAIGGGRGGNAVTNIIIENEAKVKAISGYRGAGIGAGRSGVLGCCIIIRGNSTVNAIGRGETAPGIGFGEGGSATPEAKLEISNNAQVTAQGAPAKDGKAGGVGVSCRIEKIDETAKLTRVGLDSERPVAVAQPLAVQPAAAAAAASVSGSAVLPRPSDTVRSALDAADADLQPGCIAPRHTGIKNKNATCPLNSAIQILYHDDKFREFILSREFDKEKQPYLSGLKKQFERMQAGELDYSVFVQERPFTEIGQFVMNGKTVKCEGWKFLKNNGTFSEGDGTWSQTRILEKCLEEFAKIGDSGSIDFLRKHFDYNYGKEESPNFSKFLYNGLESKEAIESVLLSEEYIPEVITLNGVHYFKYDETIFDNIKTIEVKGRTFQLDEVLMHTGGHYYVYVRDSAGWIRIDDSKVFEPVRRPITPPYPKKAKKDGKYVPIMGKDGKPVMKTDYPLQFVYKEVK